MKTLLKKHRKTNLILLISLVSAFFTFIGVSCKKPIEIDYREKFVGKYYGIKTTIVATNIPGLAAENNDSTATIEVTFNKSIDSTINLYFHLTAENIKINGFGFFDHKDSSKYIFGTISGNRIMILCDDIANFPQDLAERSFYRCKKR